MREKLRQARRDIRAFLRAHYTDERLAWLLAHAEGGRLCFMSCCCLVGITTADHALRSDFEAVERRSGDPLRVTHLTAAERLPGAPEAAEAFFLLGLRGPAETEGSDELRRRRVVPLVRAEIARRERARAAEEAAAGAAVGAA